MRISGRLAAGLLVRTPGYFLMTHVEGVLTAALSRQPSDRVVQRLTGLTRLTSSATIVEAEAVLVLANRGGSGGGYAHEGQEELEAGRWLDCGDEHP